MIGTSVMKELQMFDWVLTMHPTNIRKEVFAGVSQIAAVSKILTKFRRIHP